MVAVDRPICHPGELYGQATNEHEGQRLRGERGLRDVILTASQLRKPRPPSARSLHFPPPSAVAESTFRGLSIYPLQQRSSGNPLPLKINFEWAIYIAIYDRYMCLDLCSIK